MSHAKKSQDLKPKAEPIKRHDELVLVLSCQTLTNLILRANWRRRDYFIDFYGLFVIQVHQDNFSRGELVRRLCVHFKLSELPRMICELIFYFRKKTSPKKKVIVNLNKIIHLLSQFQKRQSKQLLKSVIQVHV